MPSAWHERTFTLALQEPLFILPAGKLLLNVLLFNLAWLSVPHF